MRSIIISIFLLFVLVVTPKHVFAEPLPDFPHIEVADVFYAPLFNDTGIFGAFGGYFGGDSGNQLIDWSIGNTIPHSGSMTDDIVFSTSLGDFMNPANWSERMRITKDGNVGIGTMSPETPFHLLGGSPEALIEATDQDQAAHLYLRSTARTWQIEADSGPGSNDNFRIAEASNDLSDAGVNRFVILPGGNVGIGTTSPKEKLHISGGNLLLDDNKFIRVGNGNHAAVNWDSANNRVEIGSAVQDMALMGGANPSVMIKSGNVGIGTTSPKVRLHVDNAGTNTVAITSYADVDYTAPTGSDIEFAFINSTTGSIETRAVYIKDNGNVGIGTTSPQGTLDVNGAIYQRGSSLHADYVFESDYALESIREHADFMWNNKHLKGIPKAMVDDQGQEIVEVGSHRKGIVEELEKAHIYISQLEEKISELDVIKAENNALESRMARLEALLNVGQ